MTTQQAIYVLTRALLYYAKGKNRVGFDEWEAPDEPNWLCPPDEGAEMLEDGGVAAAALRHVFGRALSKYDYHTSTGHKLHKVCPDHRLMQPCQRCQQRLSRIAELMQSDPAPDSAKGQLLTRLASQQEQAERWLMLPRYGLHVA